MTILRGLMPFCREVPDLLAEGGLEGAPWHKRLLIRMHLAICAHCSRFANQLALIANALRDHWTRQPSPERLEVVKRRIMARLGMRGRETDGMGHDHVRTQLRETEPLRRLYAKASRYYDLLDWPLEFFRYQALRHELWKGLSGKILDLGAGTGRNAPFYPADADVITADLSPEMLERARERIEATGRKAHTVVTDALSLDFNDGEFDACVSTFLFCVLPDEMQERALREIKRVLKPTGKVYLLEYVYSRELRRRLWMKLMSPWVERLYGARFDRKTQEHCVTAGYEVIERRFVHSDTVLKLVGRPLGDNTNREERL